MPFGPSVGQIAPRVEDASVAEITERQVDGPVFESIFIEAEAQRASLIAMPTAGHHSFLVALRGSTSEHAVHQTPYSVLALLA